MCMNKYHHQTKFSEILFSVFSFSFIYVVGKKIEFFKTKLKSNRTAKYYKSSPDKEESISELVQLNFVLH